MAKAGMRKGLGVVALISVDKFSAKNYLEELRSRGYSIEEVDLSSVNKSQLIARLFQVDLFSSGKVFLLKGLTSKEVKRRSQEITDILKQLVKAGRNAILWLVEEKWILKPDILGEPLYSYINSRDVRKVFLETPRKRKSHLEKAIELADKFGLKLDDELISLILERFQGNMDEVKAFLQKLSNSGITSHQEIEAILLREGSESTLDNLQLLDAFTHKEWEIVLRTLRKLRKRGEDLTPFYYLLASQFALGLRVLDGLRRGRELKEIAYELGVHQFRVIKVAEILRKETSSGKTDGGDKWSEWEIMELLKLLAIGEVDSKRGRRTLPDILEGIIRRFMRGG